MSNVRRLTPHMSLLRNVTLLLLAGMAQSANAALDGLGSGSQGLLQLLLLGVAAVVPIVLAFSFLISAVRSNADKNSPGGANRTRIARIYFWLIALLLAVPLLRISLLVHPEMQPYLWQVEASPPFHPHFVGPAWFIVLLASTLGLSIWAQPKYFRSRHKGLFVVCTASAAAIAYLSRGPLWGLLYLGPAIYAFYILRTNKGA